MGQISIFWNQSLQQFAWLSVLACLSLGLLSCSAEGGPIIQDSYELATFTPIPTDTPLPTSVPRGAENIALAFYRAWEEDDYASMYGWTAARSQALVPLATFTDRYEEVMETARVTELIIEPQTVNYLDDDGTAEFLVRVTFDTAVVGKLIRNHTVPLIFENGEWRVDWNEGLILPELTGGNNLRLTIQASPRARLYDRGETLLSYQGTGAVIGVQPDQLTDEAGFLNMMSVLLDTPPADLQAAYADLPANWFVPLGTLSETDLQDNFAAIEPYVDNGFMVRRGSGRIYAEGDLAPHLTGYTAYIPQDFWQSYWARGYRADERIGITGLEAAAEQWLGGTRGGQLTLISPSGETIDVIQESLAEPGRPVHATFDAEFQLAVQTALEQALLTHPDGQKGAIVVLDVNNSAVRAMASYPDFDGSVFSEINQGDGNLLAALLEEPGQPMLNRALQGAYPPGSTFKIVTTAAGLDSGLFAADTRYNCVGVWDELGDALIKYDWLEGGHGNVTLSQALTRSCNPYMYHIGFTLENSDRFLLPNMARQFGLGEITDIPGIVESAGAIPDPEWKLAVIGDGWSPGDSVNMAIGQGFVLATPLQIANMTAAVANGGKLYRPQLVDRIEGTSSIPEIVIQPELIREIALAPEHITALQASMNDVTSGPLGTAVNKMEGLAITTAGKTGTAQTGGETTLPHSWFTGYAPAEAPEIAIAVLIENAGEGSAVAAPIFRRVVELYYAQEITPFPWE